jgi:hypothetical protein
MHLLILHRRRSCLQVLSGMKIMNDTVNITFSRALVIICLVILAEYITLFSDDVEYKYLI